MAPGKEEKKPLSAQIPGPPENPIPEPFERKRMEETKKVEPGRKWKERDETTAIAGEQSCDPTTGRAATGKI